MPRKADSAPLNRRQFIGRVSGAAVSTGIGLALVHKGVDALSAETKLEKRNEQPEMLYRPFGKTNLNVSRLSFGCIQLSADRLPILEMAVERGVNLVHIGNGYLNGQAMDNLGKFLRKPGMRDKVWIAVKGEHDKGLFENIDDQLKVMGTDHIDIICSPVWNPDQIKSEKELAKFEALKQAGKVRFLNLTTHQSLQQAMETGLDTGWYPTILSVITPANVDRFKATMKRAAKENVGIMAMKTAMGRKAAPADQVAAALLPAGVTTILKTLNTREQVDAWFAAVKKAPRELAGGPAGLAVAASDCTLCGICEGCPRGVAIQSIVRDYTYYYEQQELPELAAERYAETDPKRTAPACGDCGRCEEKCPYGVPVRRIIQEAHARFGARA